MSAVQRRGDAPVRRNNVYRLTRKSRVSPFLPLPAIDHRNGARSNGRNLGMTTATLLNLYTWKQVKRRTEWATPSGSMLRCRRIERRDRQNGGCVIAPAELN